MQVKKRLSQQLAADLASFYGVISAAQICVLKNLVKHFPFSSLSFWAAWVFFSPTFLILNFQLLALVLLSWLILLEFLFAMKSIAHVLWNRPGKFLECSWRFQYQAIFLRCNLKISNKRSKHCWYTELIWLITCLKVLKIALHLKEDDIDHDVCLKLS